VSAYPYRKGAPTADAGPLRSLALTLAARRQPPPANSTVGLLGVTNPRGSPPHALFEEAQGVFQVEASYVGAPEQIEVRRCPLRPVPPQPQKPRRPPPLAPGQTLDLDQDERASHDGQGSPSASSLVVVDLGV
jgi:hypothetical protein